MTAMEMLNAAQPTATPSATPAQLAHLAIDPVSGPPANPMLVGASSDKKEIPWGTAHNKPLI